MAELAGCVCFTLYSGLRGRGSSQNIGVEGLHHPSIILVHNTMNIYEVMMSADEAERSRKNKYL